MRINHLDVRAYGPFTGREFDLSAGHGKLELIYGPNEAGKSSLLRTISDLLFGIHERTKENFVHPNASLLIGATIEHQGKSLTVFRRKVRANNLFASDSKTPLSEAEARALIPIENKASFESMFGINAVRLTEGGDELINGKGDFGKLLFSAGSGIEDFRKIVDRLTEEADALFKPRSGSIGQLLEKCRTLEATIKDTLVNTTDLTNCYRLQEETTAKAADINAELNKLSLKQNRLKLVQQALESITTRELKRASLNQLIHVPIAREGFEVEYNLLASDIAKAEEQRKELLEKLGPNAEAAPPPEIDFEQADARAAELGQLLTIQETSAETAASDIADATRAAESLRRELSELPPPSPLEALEQTLQATAEIATQAAKIAAETKRIAGEEEKLRVELAGLGWTASAKEFAAANLPADAVVQEWRNTLATAASRRETLRAEFEKADQAVRDGEEAIRQRTAGRSIPTLESLRDARQLRDQLWQSIQLAWRSGEPEPKQAEQLTAAITAADQIADSLREHADELTQLAQAQAALLSAQANREARKQTLLEAEHQSAQLNQQWQALWQPWNIAAQAPAQMAAWLVSRHGCIQRINRLETDKGTLESLITQTAHAVALLRAALPEPSTADSLPALRIAATNFRETQRAHQQQRDAITAKLEDAQQRLAQAKTRAEKISATLATLRAQWSELLATANLPATTTPAAARTILNRQATRATQAAQLAATQHQLEQAHTRMTALLAEAGCNHASQLPAYIQQSKQRAALEAELATIDEQLKRIASPDGVEALEQEAAKYALHEIPTGLDYIARASEQLHHDLTAANQELGSLKTQLAAFEGRNEAPRAAAELEETRAQLQEETLRYTRLKLAEHVLNTAVTTHRKKAEGEMLRRSSQIFAQLTLGNFQGLELDWEDNKVVAIRTATNTPIHTEAMSSGTRDQLYLALRIASLELYFNGQPSVPFIADDVLIHFDDARTAAALQVLATLAKQTQVLLFTHHEHLLEVAARALQPDQLAIYRI